MKEARLVSNSKDIKQAGFAVVNFMTACLTIFPIYNFDGNPLGLIDAQGQVIVPAKYSEVRYLDHGLYLMRSIDAGLVRGRKFFLFDHNGQAVKTKVPNGTEFSGIYSMGANADGGEICRTHVLPKGTIQIFSKDDKFGLATTSGEIVLPARFGAIDNVNGGLALIFESPVGATGPDCESYAKADAPEKAKNVAFTFNTTKHNLEKLDLPAIYSVAPEYSDGFRSFCTLTRPWIHSYSDESGKVKGYQVLHGYLDAAGKIAIEPQFNRAGNFERGFATVTVYPGPAGQSGDFFVIDRQGNRASPPGMAVFGRWNGMFRTRTRPVGSDGLLNAKYEYVLPPEYSTLSARPDGTFLTARKGETEMTVLSPDGKAIYSMPNEELNKHRILFRYVPKAKYSASIKGMSAEQAFITDYAFDSLHLGSRPEISPHGLVTSYSPFLSDNGNRPLTPFSSAQIALFWPHVGEVQCESDRFIMRNARGVFGFDSTVWKDRQASLSDFSQLPGKREGPSKISFVHIAELEMFNRFLHEYNLIGMSKDELMQLLGPGSEFMLTPGGCTGPGFSLKVKFLADKVCSWNFGGGTDITEDVVLVPELCQIPVQ